MTALTQDLLAQLQGAPMQQIASRLGLDPQQTASAINTALPLLLLKLGKNAAQPQGAQALLGALQANHSGLDVGNVLATVLGGDGGAASNGAGILGHVFGSLQGAAQNAVAHSSGLHANQVGQLLEVLAPVVMAHLGSRVGGGDAQALRQLLGQAPAGNAAASGSIVTLLDQFGAGELGLGDLLKAGKELLEGGGGR